MERNIEDGEDTIGLEMEIPYKSRDIEDAGKINENGNHVQEEGDALGCNPMSNREVVAKMPVARDAVYYNMNHPKRGIALIFNHENFQVAGLKSRAGTAEDSKNLANCFRTLGFDVRVFKDLIYQDIEKHISEVSKLDHSKNDCVVISILSHGEQGVIYAKDMYYKPDSLWWHFTPERCPSLSGKPKLFFIQACQGDKLDPGVKVVRTETDGEEITSYRIPQQADFLIMYSTVKGYFSWRNTTKGSWFVQVLTKELEARALQCDLLTILTFVNQRVAIDFESNVPDTPVMHKQKQIPCIMSMLTRLIQFNVKTLVS